MENYDYIGYVGSFFVSINLIPQIYHIYIIKEATSISIISYILNINASILLVIYGYLIKKNPVMISNGMVLIFSIMMLVLKYIYKKNDITYEKQIEVNDNII
jgi:uncharacterized protein with PQ loop repeat